MTLLILRPQPGAEQTRGRAEALGFASVVAPLFVVEPVAWVPPDSAGVTAVAMTSANAARHAGHALARFVHLPLYAVGEATAAAGRAMGFTRITAGAADAAALAALIVRGDAGRVLHLAGEAHRPLGVAGGCVRVVYRAAPVAVLSPMAVAAARRGAVALLHSPRAATLFRTLATAAGLRPDTLRIAAISPAALAAAGAGWAAAATAERPDDDALLAAAARLCDQDAGRDA